MRLEVTRQLDLLQIRDELQERGAGIGNPVEVSSIFAQTASNVLKKKQCGPVLIALPVSWAKKISPTVDLVRNSQRNKEEGGCRDLSH